MRIPKFLFFILGICLFSAQSCKKSNDPTPTPAPVVKPDTLTAGWSKQVISGETDFGDICFNSATTGYLLGAKIYKSVDGGNTWSAVSSTGYNCFNSFMTNDSKVFFVGTNSLVAKTIDGGSTFVTTPVAATLTDIFFVDNTNGYAIWPHGLFNTVDGGVTWVRLTTPSLPDLAGNYCSIAFASNTTGWIVSGNSIYRSVGSNLNWQAAVVTGANPAAAFQSLFVTSATNIYAADSYGEIFRSTDGGANFSFVKQLDNAVAGVFTDIHFISDLAGYASNSSHVYKTTDGGLNWTKVVSLGEATITEIHFTDAAHGWACGSNGTVLTFK